MSKISSINFKKSVDFQVFHNSTVRPNYVIGGELIANRKGYEALKLKEQIIENAKEAYIKNTKQKFQAKSYEWSAVVNIKQDTTMQDLENLAKHFEDKYGFQCYQIAIHRDEGHIDDNGNKAINHHAHLEFITLDKATGKNCFKLRDFPKSKMREIQDEVAEILKMERGQDKRISKRERIEPRKYAQMKEQERKEQAKLKAELEQEKLSKKKLEKLIEAERKAMLQENKELKEANQQAIYIADDYKKLRALKEKQDITIAELNAEIEQIKQEAKEREENLRNEIRSKDQQIEALKAENNEIKAQKHTLTQEQIQEIINQALEKTYADLKEKEKIIQTQNQEISKLQAKNDNYFVENDKLNSLCQFLQNEVDKLQKKIRNYNEDDYTNDYTDTIEISEQDQTHNEDDLGIHNIFQPRKNK